MWSHYTGDVCGIRWLTCPFTMGESELVVAMRSRSRELSRPRTSRDDPNRRV
jgi:hypothetical protein